MHFYLLLKNNTTEDHFKTQTRGTHQRAMEKVLQGLQWKCKFCIPVPPNGWIGTKVWTSLSTGCVAHVITGGCLFDGTRGTAGRDFWQLQCTVTSWVSSFLLPALCKDDLLHQSLSNAIASAFPVPGEMWFMQVCTIQSPGKHGAVLKPTAAIGLQRLDLIWQQAEGWYSSDHPLNICNDMFPSFFIHLWQADSYFHVQERVCLQLLKERDREQALTAVLKTKHKNACLCDKFISCQTFHLTF